MTFVESMMTCCLGTVLRQTLTADILKSLFAHLNVDIYLIPKRMVGQSWCPLVSVLL